MSVIHVAIPMALPYGRSPSKLQDFTMAIPMAIRMASPIAIEVTSFSYGYSHGYYLYG